MKSISATGVAPVNIAVIKYWGKRDEELILPINDSLSVTLSTDEMCAKTTIILSESFTSDRMWLNGIELKIEDNPRLVKCIQEVKCRKKHHDPNYPGLNWKLSICSENNFPTAAGLASSAAGYACLVFTLSKVFKLDATIELSDLARQGSGSACRSIYGGFVQWHKGVQPDGRDSIARQIATSSHWPNLHCVILVVNDAKKGTASTSGMAGSVKTSELIHERAEKIVPKRIAAISEAIKERDFAKFANITMRDSNQFHAICLDTFPPCVYMRDVSHQICQIVHRYNELVGGIRAAYTFDAGPNACIYLLKEHVNEFVGVINECYKSSEGCEYLKGLPIESIALPEQLAGKFDVRGTNLLKYIIHTRVGDGPKELDEEFSLLSTDGLPKRI